MSVRLESRSSIARLGVRLDQRTRQLIAGLLGTVGGAIAGFLCPWQLSVLLGWDIAAVFLLGAVWSFVPALDAADTQRVATREDDSRAALDVFVVVAAVISLVGVVVGLAEASTLDGAMSVALTTVAVVSVLLSWLTVQTLFTLRYARLYYGEPVGGVDFNDHRPPDYLDFAYLAFTIGMTFQVSDSNVSARAIRRAITRHALLSYLFGTIIIGVAINVVGSLIL